MNLNLNEELIINVLGQLIISDDITIITHQLH